MSGWVLDSWALIAFFEDEPAAEAVDDILHNAVLDRQHLYLSVMNWAEVHYNTMRTVSLAAAEARAAEIATLPITIVGVSEDLKMTRLAAKFKANHRISLTDAFAAALAKDKNAKLVTGDPEFKSLKNEIGIHWLKNSTRR